VYAYQPPDSIGKYRPRFESKCLFQVYVDQLINVNLAVFFLYFSEYQLGCIAVVAAAKTDLDFDKFTGFTKVIENLAS
jgi:hypothetical protein